MGQKRSANLKYFLNIHKLFI